LVIYSRPLVALLYQHGAFTAGDTALVSSVQIMCVLQVPFYALSMLFVRLISALRLNRIFIWGNILSVVLNAGLDIVLMRTMGVAGIALATTLWYVVSCAFLGTVVWFVLPKTSPGPATTASVANA